MPTAILAAFFVCLSHIHSQSSTYVEWDKGYAFCSSVWAYDQALLNKEAAEKAERETEKNKAIMDAARRYMCSHPLAITAQPRCNP